jgi:hypothetical protein
VRRRGGEQVAAGALFVSRVEGEEVLEQPRRCLACTEPRLAREEDEARGHCTGRHVSMALWMCLRMDGVCDVYAAADRMEYGVKHSVVWRGSRSLCGECYG